ncbi:MAG: type II toxin-antitoxin system PemK/MazF family toxin [Chloroflexaceae bacterium]|nr:type II toxin-antitoxin system PemK/MazF family toxin [Chloroflexaceae bacterium]
MAPPRNHGGSFTHQRPHHWAKCNVLTSPYHAFQNDAINRYTSTVLTIPFTTNLRRANLPSCVLVPAGEGGLSSDSVALCHQLRVLDISRLERRLGVLSAAMLADVEDCVLFTMGM